MLQWDELRKGGKEGGRDGGGDVERCTGRDGKREVKTILSPG